VVCRWRTRSTPCASGSTPKPTGGAPFWEEEQQVRTQDGLFSILLGSVTPIGSVPATGAAYLGMSVESSAEMTPRLRIAGAYASPSKQAGTSFVSPGGTDNDDEWIHYDSILYTVRRLGLSKAGAGNKFYGSYNYTQNNFGASCTVGTSGYSVGNISIAAGTATGARRRTPLVCGGRNNKAGNEARDTSAIVVAVRQTRPTRSSRSSGRQENTAGEATPRSAAGG